MTQPAGIDTRPAPKFRSHWASMKIDHALMSEVEFSVAEINSLLKAHGLRKTFTRVCLLQCLAAQSTPITHAEIQQQLQSPGFESSTVFRGLNDLVTAGIVKRLDLGDCIWRFELNDLATTPPGNRQGHLHAMCRQCGRVECLHINLREILNPQLSKWDWTIDDAVFQGFCAVCTMQLKQKNFEEGRADDDD